MPRAERDVQPGIHHASTHSVWTSVLFRDDIDRVNFLIDLARIAAKYGWTIIAFCLLTTHYHVLAETQDESLAIGMQELNFRHAIRFNTRHKLRGHVVDGRYWNQRIQSESHLLAAFRYIARNALEAGLCASPADWPWCSYRNLTEPAELFSFVDPSRVIDCWAPGETTLEQLRRFVESPW
jgi:REP element-mobilizing transposase RayT